MPTFNDRFWLPGGNPDLNPERGESFDAGLIWLYGGLQIEMTTFMNRLPRSNCVAAHIGRLLGADERQPCDELRTGNLC